MGYLYLFNREIVVRYFVSRAAAAGVGDCLGCFAGCVSVYDAVFVDKLCRRQFVHRLSDLLSLPVMQLGSVYTRGPADINVDLTDSVRVEPLIIYYIYMFTRLTRNALIFSGGRGLMLLWLRSGV